MATRDSAIAIRGGIVLTVIGGVGAALAYAWAPRMVLVSSPAESSQAPPHGLLAWALGLLIALLGVATAVAGLFPHLAEAMRQRRHSVGLVATVLILAFLWAFYR
jgi:hypothetical protein